MCMLQPISLPSSPTLDDLKSSSLTYGWTMLSFVRALKAYIICPYP